MTTAPNLNLIKTALNESHQWKLSSVDTVDAIIHLTAFADNLLRVLTMRMRPKFDSERFFGA